VSELRIIGGQWRGRKLSFTPIEGLRPTPDRVRETLFNWLMHDIHGARCCDLFAGSGLLGFEALSRGAAHVDMVDTSKKVIQTLEDNRKKLNIDNIAIIKKNALDFLKDTKTPYDIIFLDPPFTQNLWEPCLNLIRQHKLLTKDGLIYIETPKHKTLDTECFDLLKTKTAGDVQFCLVRLI